MSVYKAICAVQSDLVKTGISKDSTNTFDGYKFLGIDAVYNALSPLLAKHGLCILPRIISRTLDERVSKKGDPVFYVTVEAEFDFVCADDGTTHTVKTFGEAMDRGDKATNKAMSAAYKYAAFQAFAIPTEGDNDADSSTHTVEAKLKHKPTDGAMESLPEETQVALRDMAIEVMAYAESGRIDKAISLRSSRARLTASALGTLELSHGHSLTPALSPRERENDTQHSAMTNATSQSPGSQAGFPFPEPRDSGRQSAPSALQKDWATVVLQDVYRGLEPHVKRGEVKEICVVEEMRKAVRTDVANRHFGFQFPVISCGATYAGKDVIGEVDVNPDGSAYFQVPSGVPLYFMALDQDGRAVQRMRSFTHLMPGEVQGCVGCHESRLDSPLRHLAGLGLEPKKLQPPEWGSGGFDYSRIVQPVLDQHCVQCHHPHDTTNTVDLTGDKTDWFNVSYDVLARERQGGRGTSYVNWIPTYNGQEWNILQVAPKTWGSPQSKLADLVLSGHRFTPAPGRARRGDPRDPWRTRRERSARASP